MLLSAIKSMPQMKLTENGAITYASSGSDCLDFFAQIGAMREASADAVVAVAEAAFRQDPDCAMRILFFARDIRGGLGERSVFRLILRAFATLHTDSVIKNIPLVAEYGRYDDLLCLLDTPCEKAAADYLLQELQKSEKAESPSLIAKWLPSVNTTSTEARAAARKLAALWHINPATYRKRLSAERARLKLVENYMRVLDYTFDYSALPSLAHLKYIKAFNRHDEERYTKYIEAVAEGKEKINTSALYPYDIVAKCLSGELEAGVRATLDVAWRSFCAGKGDGRNAIAVIDGSGSMYGGGSPLPIGVALSLGLFFAETNTGAFHNHFITFSHKPQLIEVKGEDIYAKATYAAAYDEVANTNLQAVFNLILRAAVANKVPVEELPEAIYIISDMEFDDCTGDSSLTNFETAKKKFAEAGYPLPNIVFWNVQARQSQSPVRHNDVGAALVSGASASIFNLVVGGELDPMSLMNAALKRERYQKIKA